MVVIASIHQPSTSTLMLFDNVLLLSRGSPVYFGPPSNSIRYFRALGQPPPTMMSPAEFMLELTNTDFSRRFSLATMGYRLETLVSGWEMSLERKLLDDQLVPRENKNEEDVTQLPKDRYSRSLPMQSWIILQRMAVV
jgi:ABC-type multidrug transport system ATPase subunit